MSQTRTLSADIFAAIRAGQLAPIQNYVTPENINILLPTKDDAKFTLLTFAAFHDQLEIVDYLLKHPGMNLKVNQQGRHVLKVAVDKQHSRTLIRLLSEKTLALENGHAIIPVTDFALIENIKKKLTLELCYFVKNIASYQAMFYIRHPNFEDSLNKIERMQTIAEYFAEYGYPEAAQLWSEVHALEVVRVSKSYNVYSCPMDKVDILVNGMINTLNAYQKQTMVPELIYKISNEGAYGIAVRLGMLDYSEKFKMKDINYKKYFHAAYAISNTPNFSFGAEQEIQKKFLQAYVQTHTDSQELLVCLQESRLSKQLKHLFLLREAREFNPTQIIYRAQSGYAATLLTRVDEISDGKDKIVSQGLKLFYGIDMPLNYAAAAEKFKEAALQFKKAENEKKLEAFLLALMAHHQHIQTQNDRLFAINVHQDRALLVLNEILPLYHQDIALQHEMEIFALLIDMLIAAPRNHDKILYLNQLLKYLLKISQFTIYTKNNLIDYIFDRIIKSEILNDEELFAQVVKMMKICLQQASSAFNWKLIFNKWNTLIDALTTQQLANTHLKCMLVMAKLETAPLYFQMNSPYLNYNEIIYADAIKCLEILPALARQAGMELDLQPYSWIYYDYANLQSLEAERDNFYFKAINLRSTAALIALMALPSAKKYEAAILQGLQNAIADKDVSLITIINKYLASPDQGHYSAKLLERSMRALASSVKNSYARQEISRTITTPKSDIEMTVIRQGFFHAINIPVSLVVSDTNFFQGPRR